MVCLGNICRSPLAEGILASKTQHLNVTVDSAGTGGYHIGALPDNRSIEIAEKIIKKELEDKTKQDEMVKELFKELGDSKEIELESKPKKNIIFGKGPRMCPGTQLSWDVFDTFVKAILTFD